MGGDVMHARRRPTVLLPKGDDGMQRSTLFDRVCYPRAVMACHARRRLTVFAVQGL